MEKYLGFWTSFLLSLVSLALGTAVLVFGRNKYYHRAPEASFRAKLLSALGCAIKGGFHVDAAEPVVQLEKHGRVVSWDTQFVHDIRQALQACKVLSIYPIIWLCYDQNMTNLVSQAGQMITYGIPNDAIPSLNPICVLVIIPILERFVYPYMQKIGVSPRPTVRMTLGFGLMAVSMAIAAGVQRVVYSAPPCYDMPLECPASENGKTTNQASVLLQLPIYVVGALGEMLFSVSGSEYAYNKAPAHMKSTLQAATMFTVALGSGLGIAVSPVAHNPRLVILFSSLTAVITITTVAFGWVFWGSN